MKAVIITVCYLLLCSIFFIYNEIDRGEHGGLLYTSTKCIPILALCIFSITLFNGGTTVGRNTALALLLAAAGDLFLSTRSLSAQNFMTGIVPFGVSHYFFILTMRSDRGGLKFWLGGLVPLVIHAAIMGLLTNGKFEFPALQAFCSVYAVVLLLASWLSFSAWYREPKKMSTQFRALGYLIFMVSDTLLTVDAYVWGFSKAQVYTMITYYAAQLLICLSGFYLEKELTSTKQKAA